MSAGFTGSILPALRAIISDVVGGALLHLYRKQFRVLNDFIGEVYIEIGPVEVACSRLLDVQNFPDRSIFEPGEIVIRQEQFSVPGQQPYAIARNMGYLN